MNLYSHKYLPRASFKVLLQHPQFNDITGVPDDRHYGNRVTAPDVAVNPLDTVKTERAGHPEPCLQAHTDEHKRQQNYTFV